MHDAAADKTSGFCVFWKVYLFQTDFWGTSDNKKPVLSAECAMDARKNLHIGFKQTRLYAIISI
ncbi:MAG: hypothetical protein Q3Y08_06130, partial [Butyricicoccus sp.]|nr:hypothetical protein [Butyricicoccus sp.]